MKDSSDVFSSGDEYNSVACDGYLKVTSKFIRPTFKLLGQLEKSLQHTESGYHGRIERLGRGGARVNPKQATSVVQLNAMAVPLARGNRGAVGFTYIQ